MTDPPMLSVAAAVAVWLRGGRMVIWHQDVFPEVAQRLGYLSAGRVYRLLKALRDASVRSAIANVSISPQMTALIASLGGRKAREIPNWALEEGAEHGPALRRAEFALQGKFVVMYSGNLGRAHDLTAVLNAARVLLRSAPHVQFVFVGSGVGLNDLRSAVDGGCLGNISFFPPQPRSLLRSTLEMADIHLAALDPRVEGLVVPSKFVGVIALGKPVIWLGTQEGYIAELIRSYQCGRAFTAECGQELASWIATISSQPSLIRELEVNATRLWSEKFQKSNALRAWASLLGEKD